MAIGNRDRGRHVLVRRERDMTSKELRKRNAIFMIMVAVGAWWHTNGIDGPEKLIIFWLVVIAGATIGILLK